MFTRLDSWCFLCLWGVFVPMVHGDELPRIDFGSQIRPIFGERCYECHGPEKQEGNLRLDRRSDAMRGGDSGSVIQPGDSTKSSLIAVLESTDDDVRMPQGRKPLTAEQIQLLKRWIDGGAEWPDAWSGDAAAVRSAHWSFRPVKRQPLPVVRDPGWARGGIDTWIQHRREGDQLAPSPEADRLTLIRRVYFDLIGLPPTPEEADAFAQDPHPAAYERLVDELLASPRYGERWGRRWLDLARYADTNGYEKDRPRSVWPYRDWVIRALNADMSFDLFTIRQLAGDLLPQATWEDRVATGFHRNTMMNEEGGIDPLEFRYYSLVDRVNTTGTVWFGLTFGCGQCHSHKYDPLSQREYYQVMAFLNNCDELEMEVPDPRVARERAEVEQRIARLQAALPEQVEVPAVDPADPRPIEERRHAAVEKKFAAWLEAESAQASAWNRLEPQHATSNLPLLTILPDRSVLASGDQTKSDKYEVTFQLPVAGITAIRLEALPHESLPLNGPGRAYYEGPKGDFFLSELRGNLAGQPVKFRSATHDYSKLSIGGGRHGAEFAVDGDMTTGWSTSGREGEPHAAVFVLDQPTTQAGELKLELVFERHFSCGLGRFRVSVTSDPTPSTAHGLTSELEQSLTKPAQDRTDEERQSLFRQFLATAPEFSKPREELQKLRDSLPRRLTSLVLQERPAGRERVTTVQHRGEYLQPKQPVEPGIPEFLAIPGADRPRNRLEFARWLVRPEHPLTARVTANRQWQAFFGRGLVRTLEDVGVQGETPSHPELLDYLAMEFTRAGTQDGTDGGAWSLKRLHRQIVLSATYRQSSRVTPALLAADPLNILLARGPRVRLEAELIRDAALHSAGLLSTKMGGPGVYPPQPPTVTTEGTYGALAWKASPGEDKFRRGVYTYAKRTAPFAMFGTFDAPSGEACLARREASNSALQALTLMNDTMFVEAASWLGSATAAQPGDDEQRARWLLRRCLTRQPSAEELASLVRFVTSQRERFSRGELDPRKFTPDGDGDLVAKAAWSTAARALLNLDETIVKR